jgi:hypothetical protein
MTLTRLASSVTAVSPRLFLGSLADAERLAKDNPYQIQTVITLCEERVKHRSVGIRYLEFSVAVDTLAGGRTNGLVRSRWE